jgi:aspartate/glutamate racemase
MARQFWKPTRMESDIILESKNEICMLPSLLDSVRRLNTAGCSFILMPCNTLHIFIKEMRDE